VTERPGPRRARVAVIGSGVAGLGAAYRLAPHCEVVLYEAAARAGGHAHSVQVTLDGVSHAVDVGFLVFNHRTYPRLRALFAELDVETAAADMSFAVSIGPHAFEWCGKDDLRAVFAQPRNALRPRFWRMLFDLVRFNDAATRLARSPGPQALGDFAPHRSAAGAAGATRTDPKDPSALTLAEFLDAGRYSSAFREDYLLPMAGAIWSCPLQTMLAFPALSFARFCDNHGLLQLRDRPQWFTVAGGSERYVNALLTRLRAHGASVHLGCAVHQVQRQGGRLWLRGDATKGPLAQAQAFDAVVLATHAPQALALLEQPSNAEQRVLGALRTQPNQAYLHTDRRLMPRRERAWGAWNYLARGPELASRPTLSAGPQRPSTAPVSVSYWLQALQPLPFKRPLFVSLNPLTAPDPACVLGEFEFAHPVYDLAALEAQQNLSEIQGAAGVWFAGAWTGYGFHEDGLRAGEQAAAAILAQFATREPQAGERTAREMPTQALTPTGDLEASAAIQGSDRGSEGRPDGRPDRADVEADALTA